VTVNGGGRIVQLSVSNGGVPKRAVPTARVSTLGLAGDAHHNHEHHGGPERAVCLYSMEAIRALNAEGHRVEPGGLGENVTLEGLDWAAVEPGAHLLLGDRVLLQVTRYTTPCFNIKAAFKDGDFARVSHKRHAGWSRVYARVLVEGSIRAGDPARLVDAPAAAALARG
jgi:MOSC domain-containing protein YiiM